MYARDTKKLLQFGLVMVIFLIAATACFPDYKGVFINMDTVGTTSDGVNYDKNDILFLDLAGGNSPVANYTSNWITVFDGEDYGLNDTKHDLSAFSFNEQTFDYIFLGNELDTDEELYLSFEANRTKIPGIFPTWVYGQDIVKFTNGAANYDGYEYEMFFDGSDVGLTTMSEKVDGISVWPPEYYEVLAADVDFPYDCNAGVIFLSTRGRYRVNNNQGGFLVGDGSDVLAFCATNLGYNTAGFWFRAFDGSEANIDPPNALTGLDVIDVDYYGITSNVDSGTIDNGITFLFTPRRDFTGDTEGGGTLYGQASELNAGIKDGNHHYLDGPFWNFNEDGSYPAVNGFVENISLLDMPSFP